MQYIINRPEEWRAIAEQIAGELKHPIVLLKGNLGAGKTTFSKYLLEALGSRDEVSSPTYAIVNEYDSPKGLIFHFDLYRLRSVEEVREIGMDDYLDDAFLCIIEWPEIYEDMLADYPHHTLSISHAGEGRTAEFN